MAYNNYFPVGYQPYIYQQPFQQQYQPIQQASEAIQPQANTNIHQQATTPQNGFNWVQGEAGAKAYFVAPNQTAQLWDSESQTIYLKSADASGMPSMKILDYQIRDTQTTPKAVKLNEDMSKYVTRDEFEQRIAEISQKTTSKKAVKIDE